MIATYQSRRVDSPHGVQVLVLVDGLDGGALGEHRQQVVHVREVVVLAVEYRNRASNLIDVVRLSEVQSVCIY